MRVAISNSGYKFPTKKVIVNLAPASLRKEGPAFDLPIALAVLAASGAVPQGGFEGAGVVGELSLDGGLRGIRGALSMAEGARREGLSSLVVPRQNAAEAAAIGGGVPDYPGLSLSEHADEATRPLAEAGEGEAEGQELAEMELMESAQPADGISDAFRAVEQLVGPLSAFLAGDISEEEALERYQKERDASAIPLLEHTVTMSSFDSSPMDRATAFLELQGLHAQETERLLSDLEPVS